MDILISVISIIPGMCETITGGMLVKSVIQIRSFMKQNNEEDQMDTAALCRHALSFGLYMFAVFSYNVTYIVYTLKKPNDKWFVIWQSASIACWLLALISECLLAYIFCDFINVEVEDEEDRAGSIAQTEEFDEEAELNAKIWNNFMLRVKEEEVDREGSTTRMTTSEGQKKYTMTMANARSIFSSSKLGS
jgi:hypothetical protein